MSKRRRSPRALGAGFLIAVAAAPVAGQMDGEAMPPIEEYATAEQLGANPPGSPGSHIFEHEGGPYSSVVVVVPDFIEVSMPSAARGG